MLPALLLAQPVAAANISILAKSSRGTLVGVEGELILEDGEKFAALMKPIDRAVVVFNSPGGSLLAGLRIGQLIRSRNAATLVPDGSICASACALAWLGGTRRLLSPRARLGFHAAFEADTNRVSGSANALVGAYLDRLGLPDAAIYELTDAAPDSITWITATHANQIGIETEIFRLDDTPAAPQPVQPRIVSIDQQVRKLALAYFDAGSSDAQSAITWLSGHYASSINFYGKPVPLDDVLKQKRAFVQRWPERLYAPDLRNMRVSCTPSRTACLVSGTVEYECRSYVRGAYSAGSASYSLAFEMRDGSPMVVAESGKVIARR